MGEWVRLPIFGDKIVGKWIGESRTENAQDKSADKKWHGIRYDLFIDCPETHVLPVEGRAIRPAEHEGADPVGSAEDRDQGPWIVEKRACHERENVESPCPGADEHHDRVQSVERGKADEDPDGEGQRRSSRRFL